MIDGNALSGSLEFLNLGEVLQILGNNNSTGVLKITSKYAQEAGLVFIQNGDPVDASNGEQKGLKALFSLFGWTDGAFDFQILPVEKKNVINRNRMEIILDGTRQLDDGKIEKLGPVTLKKRSASSSEQEPLVPVIKGPFIDYMYVVDEEAYYEGDEILSEGNYGSWMWVILEGVVEIAKKTPKGTVKLLRLREGAYVGSLASFLSEGHVRSATVSAVSRVQLGMLDSQRLSSEFSAMSAELRRVIVSLDKRLKQVSDATAQVFLDRNSVDKYILNKNSVLEQGQIEERVFGIAQGEVTILRLTDDGRVPLARLGKGDFFGYIPFLKIGHEPYAASVLASNDLKVVPVDVEELAKEHGQLSPIFKNIVENMTTCVSVTTMMACEYQKKWRKKSKKQEAVKH